MDRNNAGTDGRRSTVSARRPEFTKGVLMYAHESPQPTLDPASADPPPTQPIDISAILAGTTP